MSRSRSPLHRSAKTPPNSGHGGKASSPWESRFREARDLERAGRTAEAIAQLETLVAAVPDEHAPRHDLAVLYRGVGRLGEALREFHEVARRFPNDSTAANDVADLLSYLGHQSLALTMVKRALALEATNLSAIMNLAEILRHMGDAAAGRDVYAAALALAPTDAKAHMQYGMTLVSLGDWPAGWAELEHRIPTMGAAALFKDRPASPRWTGAEPLAGKRLLVLHEQGLGDSIMCARFASAMTARGAAVHLRTLPPLVDLLRTAPGVAECSAEGTPLPEHDCHIPLMSLMHALDTTPENLDGAAYLSPNGECPSALASLLPEDDAFTVALTWAGNPKHSNDHRRSIPGAALAPLLTTPHVRFVALQKSPPLEQVLPAELRGHVIDIGAQCQSFNDTAHALRRVDLLVTVDTAVAHLAGALGVPSLLCLPFCPDYRWGLSGETTPWYRSITMLRQPDLAGWDTVLSDAVRRVQAGRDRKGGYAAA